MPASNIIPVIRSARRRGSICTGPVMSFNASGVLAPHSLKSRSRLLRCRIQRHCLRCKWSRAARSQLQRRERPQTQSRQNRLSQNKLRYNKLSQNGASSSTTAKTPKKTNWTTSPSCRASASPHDPCRRKNLHTGSRHSAGRAAVAIAGYSADHTIEPLTIVATGPPRNAWPWKGVLRLLEKDRFTS